MQPGNGQRYGIVGSGTEVATSSSCFSTLLPCGAGPFLRGTITLGGLASIALATARLMNDARDSCPRASSSIASHSSDTRISYLDMNPSVRTGPDEYGPDMSVQNPFGSKNSNTNPIYVLALVTGRPPPLPHGAGP